MVLVSFSLAEGPRILIVPRPKNAKEKFLPVSSGILVNALAQEFDQQGKVTPIVWGFTDPIFRQAMLDGKITRVVDLPSDDSVSKAARALGATYVLNVVNLEDTKSFKAQAELFQGGHRIWKDSQSMTISTGDKYDVNNSSASLARTWVLQMSRDAFKGLSAAPLVIAPDAGKGQAPVIPTNTTPPAELPDDTSYKAEIGQLLSVGNTAQAIAIARDAVDAKPFEAERRKILISTLMGAGEYEAAAGEADRASGLIPDSLLLRIMAARAWLSSGNVEKAKVDLNEALSRDPQGKDTVLLAAETYLAGNDPARAIEAVEPFIKSSPTAQLFFLRSIARAMIGGEEGVKLDLSEVDKLDPTPSDLIVEDRFQTASQSLARLTAAAGNQLRDLVQSAAVHKNSKEIAVAIEALKRQASARATFYATVKTPTRFDKSRERWILAQKLLLQCLTELQAYTESENADALIDCRITLGEAIKQSLAAKTEEEAERKGSDDETPATQ